MRLVDDVDLEPAAGGRRFQVLLQISDLLDAAVRGGVDLDDVQRKVAVDLLAGAASVARFAFFAELGVLGAFFAVQELGDEPGGRGLARAPGAIKKIGMRETVLAGRVPKDLHVGLLAQEIVQKPGSVFAIKR